MFYLLFLGQSMYFPFSFIRYWGLKLCGTPDPFSASISREPHLDNVGLLNCMTFSSHPVMTFFNIPNPTGFKTSCLAFPPIYSWLRAVKLHHKKEFIQGTILTKGECQIYWKANMSVIFFFKKSKLWSQI